MRLLLIVCTTMLLIGCSQFPTEFDRIETSDHRVLDFVYEPAEAGPGDTVHVKAYFAGIKVMPADIDWNVSFNVVQNRYGTTDTAFGLKPLFPVDCYYTDKTTRMEFSVVIPSDIMETSGGIPQDWSSLIPKDYQSMIPVEFRSLTKSQLLDSLNFLLSVDPDLLGIIVAAKPELKQTIPMLCQLLTVRIRLFANIKNDYLIKSDYTIRYNSHFSTVPGISVSVNKNPRIDSLGIYKVAGNLDNYDPEENRHEFFRLDVPVGQERTILVDKGFSYFVKVFTNPPDSTRTLTDIQNDTLKVETLNSQWFYQLVDSETKDVSYTDLMDINDDRLLENLTPPANKSIKNFTIWSQVYDQMLNEMMRPIGSSLIEGRGKFEYTQAYLDDVKKK